MPHQKIYYGWIVCIVSTMLIFITMGTISNGFSVYLPYIISQNGFTYSQGSYLVTLRCLIAFISMLLIGFYYRVFSIRTGASIAAFCAGLAFFIYSISASYVSFCLAAAISGISYGFGSMIPVSILMNRWFIQRKTLALSICATGSGIATIVLPSLTTLMIEYLSINLAFLIEAGFIFIMTGIIFIFLRNFPDEKGLKPYGYENTEVVVSEVVEEPVTDSWTLSKRVWIMMGLVSLFMGAQANTGFSHLAVLYDTEGFDSMIVSYIITGVGVMIVVGKLIYGEVTDKIGGYRSSILFCFFLLLGNTLCCLAFLNSTLIIILNVLFLGVGYPIATIGPSVWASDLASPDYFSTVVKRLQIIYAAGALIFASIPGILADVFGTFIPAYILFSACIAVALLFIQLAYRTQAKEA